MQGLFPERSGRLFGSKGNWAISWPDLWIHIEQRQRNRFHLLKTAALLDGLSLIHAAGVAGHWHSPCPNKTLLSSVDVVISGALCLQIEDAWTLARDTVMSKSVNPAVVTVCSTETQKEKDSYCQNHSAICTETAGADRLLILQFYETFANKNWQ